jgi:hypothetical protein
MGKQTQTLARSLNNRYVLVIGNKPSDGRAITSEAQLLTVPDFIEPYEPKTYKPKKLMSVWKTKPSIAVNMLVMMRKLARRLIVTNASGHPNIVHQRAVLTTSVASRTYELDMYCGRGFKRPLHYLISSEAVKNALFSSFTLLA